MNPIFCSDSIPNYFHFFDFTIAPPLLFYTYIPAIAVSLFLGLFVLIRQKFSLEGKLLFLITFFFSLWVLDIIVLWTAAYNDAIFFGWQITPVLEIPIFLFSIYFTYVITSKKRNDISNSIKVLFIAIMSLVFLFLPTSYNIHSYDLSICEGLLGKLWDFMYIFEFVAMFWILGICIYRYRRLSKGDVLRDQIFYFGAGILFFLVLFNGSNLLGQILQIHEISFVGSLGMVIFLSFLAYMIVRFRTFNIRLIATQALSLGIAITIASQFLYPQSLTDYIITGISLIIFIIGSYFLVRSVKREVKQREEIENLAEKLTLSNAKLEETNIKLKELDQLKSEFISLANHQISTPLTVVKGYISLIQEKMYGEVPKDIEKVLDIIHNSTDKTIGAVRNFLDLATLQQSDTQKEFSYFDLVVMLSEIVNIYKQAFKNSTVELKYIYLLNEDHTIFADKENIRQVICSIIEYSIKYTNSGYIEVKLHCQNDKKILSITDTGTRELPTVSSKFIRKFLNSENVLENTIIGNSLSLYIAKQLIESNNFKFYIKSNDLKKGAQFIIEI